MLHGTVAARNAAYPRGNSGSAFEIGTAKFGHPIEYADANLGLGFLIFERSCLEFGPDHGLPAAHSGFSPAALIVAGSPLSAHPPAD